MGKGLSDLQKEILKIALRNLDQEKGILSKQADVANREVLIEVYGFPISKLPQDPEVNACIFDPDKIGRKRYNSASVSVAKAFNRLVDRGLAERKYNDGIILTRAGVEVAKTLA